MRDWIRRLVAGPELDELERWRVQWHDTRRWLAEFPDAADALEYLHAHAKGYETPHAQLRDLRDTMRTRQAARDFRIPEAMLREAASVDSSAIDQNTYTVWRGPEPDCRKCYDSVAKVARLSGMWPPSRMFLCPTCGNKRCPRASDHDQACTGSNEPGQPSSVY